MRFLAKSIVLAALWAGILAVPAAAQAQEERIIVNFTPAFASVGGDSELALAGSAGYRFTEHFFFEGDFTWIDAAAGGDRDRVFPLGGTQLTTRNVNDMLSRTTARFGRFDLRNLPNFPIPVEGFSVSTDGQTMIGTLGVRYEPTVQTARFRPYLSGGLGFNHTEQEVMVSIGTADRDISESISHSGFAFSAGGGAGIRLFSSVWANADAKYFRLSRDRNVIRFGGGVGLRF
jgi:opacity protein-like surface antigen